MTEVQNKLKEIRREKRLKKKKFHSQIKSESNKKKTQWK